MPMTPRANAFPISPSAFIGVHLRLSKHSYGLAPPSQKIKFRFEWIPEA
jgi:hypothetical protein